MVCTSFAREYLFYKLVIGSVRSQQASAASASARRRAVRLAMMRVAAMISILFSSLS